VESFGPDLPLPITRRRIGSHTSQGRLLQSAVGRSTKVCYRTDKLQRVMNAAARVVSGTKKYDRGLTHLLQSELHWLESLDVADRVTYKLGVTLYKCLHGQAPDYLSELCTPVAQVAERQHLRFRQLPSTRCSTVSTFSSIRTAVAPSLSLDQRHGTCSKTICVSRTCKLTVFIVH